ncbi:hypothetical protein DL240_14930 [Lujinxingia litoralis]|uniref:Uncharacterized protein n=1 Tax=Lujinxingia litoralis TaxID=2211119 RepID=A0A328C399_9DELT|nr:hypothetical protein DL240_14930 [Lujinxingia litoralis]
MVFHKALTSLILLGHEGNLINDPTTDRIICHREHLLLARLNLDIRPKQGVCIGDHPPGHKPQNRQNHQTEHTGSQEPAVLLGPEFIKGSVNIDVFNIDRRALLVIVVLHQTSPRPRHTAGCTS